MRDRWSELCESAVTELDRTKFRAILREMNQLLDEKGFAPGRRGADKPALPRKPEQPASRSPR